jgi:small-conductance mechanosensitive channel
MNISDTFLSRLFSYEVIQIVVTLFIGILLQLLSQGFIERLVRRLIHADRYESKIDEKKREDTIIVITQRAFVVLLWIVIVTVILSLAHVNVAALLTGAGLFGVIVGLGAQNTIKDILAGMFILGENQYRVGDVITLSGGTTSAIGTSGTVEEITLRITKLRDLDGTLNIVRNGEAGIITNRTFKYSSVVIDLVVSYDAKIDHVESVFNRVGMEMLDDQKWNKLIIEPVRFLRIDGFTEVGVLVKGLGKVHPAAQWEVAGEFRRRIKDAFETESIHFAVPKRDLAVQDNRK